MCDIINYTYYVYVIIIELLKQYVIVTTWLGSDILNRDQGQKSHEAQSTLLLLISPSSSTV